MPDITAIVEKPDAYGFTFITETVKRDKVSSGSVPLIKLLNVPLFDKHFPGVILETEDGQSIRVNSQRVVRDAWFSGTKGMDELKVRLVRWLLKMESAPLRFAGPDDQMFGTKEEAEVAWKEWALSQ
jgi:hypothetical protein